MERRDTEFSKPAAEPADWTVEYRALRGSCAIVPRTDRAAVYVEGERRTEMLNGLLTNEVTHLEGRGCQALLLTAKGRVLTDLRFFPLADRIWLDVPSAGLANLLGAFRKYLPPLYATFRDASDSLVLVGIYGPKAEEVVRRSVTPDVPAGQLGIAEVEWKGVAVVVARDRRIAADGFEVLVPHEAAAEFEGRVETLVSDVGGCRVGARAFEVARVESGVPSYGTDIGEDNLAQETGLEAEAISYEKGCYLGQEVVARIHFRGHVNRRLVGLRMADGLAAPGAELFQDTKRVGNVTSAVESPELGAIGLGYARREVAIGETLRWVAGGQEGSATVSELPLRPRNI